MNRLFDDVFRGNLAEAEGSNQAAQGGGIIPARMNVSETENEFRITAELPGVTEQDVDVQLDDDMLTIRGEKRSEQKDEKENYHFVERSFGSFQRSLRLPFSVNPEQVQARFENGILTVTLPKTHQQERSRRIRVQGSGASGSRQNAQMEQGNGSRAGTQGSTGVGTSHDGP
jgi:HSP20 family protein